MEKTEFSVHDMVKSPMGSADTFDGFVDVERSQPSTTRRRRNNLTIIFLVLFLVWAFVFLGVTIHQIRSDDRKVSKKGVVVGGKVFESDKGQVELVHKSDSESTNEHTHVFEDRGSESKKELIEAVEDSFETSPENHVEDNFVRPQDNVKETRKKFKKLDFLPKGSDPSLPDDSALKRKLFVRETEGRFEDLKFEYDSKNCFRKEYVRFNVNGTGINSKLIVKTSNITEEKSDNFGTCATVYYWIYSKDGSNESRIYSLGPYYGHHSVNVTESIFERHDPRGSLTLFGCKPPVGIYDTKFELERMQTVTRGNAYITISSSKFKNIHNFMKVMEENRKREVDKYNKLIEMNAHDAESVKNYTLLMEASNCLYTL